MEGIGGLMDIQLVPQNTGSQKTAVELQFLLEHLLTSYLHNTQRCVASYYCNQRRLRLLGEPFSGEDLV